MWGQEREDREAILRGTAVGQDGRSASLTAPNGPAQEGMIMAAVREAQMTPPESTVWECHGTGTSLGDPIEVGAVRKTQIRMKRSEPLMLGSVKSNYGHMEGSAAMGGICKCVCQVRNAKCAPTLHVRTLNPHLEHAAFDAIFETEAAIYPYTQGHSQVSSFGFGGTNGHGILWGRNDAMDIGALGAFEKKIRNASLPEVRPQGNSPDDWDHDYPALTMEEMKNNRYSLFLAPEAGPDEPLKWTKEEEVAAPVGEEDEVVEDFYAITGNFNSWADDRMIQSDVAGLHTITVEMPESGTLEFRFLKNSLDTEVIAPASDRCGRKSETILGPEEGLRNCWLIKGTPGQDIAIELFMLPERRTILWIKM